MNRQVVERTARYVRDELFDDASGHDWWHVDRVRKLALALGRNEGADLYIVELAALLHDISDYKLNGGDHERGAHVANHWLISLGETQVCADAVSDIVIRVSFKGAGVKTEMRTVEGEVVQDADRLDAIGAIGIARAFAYGGYAGEPMHEPSASPQYHETLEEYMTRSGGTIAHFYEKLFLLKDRMNTESARVIALRRHMVMERFVEEFLREWEAVDVAGEAGVVPDREP